MGMKSKKYKTLGFEFIKYNNRKIYDLNNSVYVRLGQLPKNAKICDFNGNDISEEMLLLKQNNEILKKLRELRKGI